MDILNRTEKDILLERYASVLAHKDVMTKYSAYMCGISTGMILGLLIAKSYDKKDDKDNTYIAAVVGNDFKEWLLGNNAEARANLLS